MFDPDAGMPRLNRSLVYLGACIIAGLRLARERQVNVRVIPTQTAISESVGHVSIDTTNIYAEVDLKRKAEILEHSTALPASRSRQKHWRDDPSLIGFLRSL
jgi:hypothetical protein